MRALCKWFPVAALLFALFLPHRATHAAAKAPAKPKLVVVVVVDQMRADYFEWYGENWHGGLRRLFDGGAWFGKARYPYLNTVTCPGHATIGTGAYPHTHGMILNTWYDRERKKVIECTDDPETPLVAYGQAGKLENGDSAKNLMAPTLGDEMQAQLQPRPRVMSFSYKARASIDIGGHQPDATLWFEDNTWVTSSKFTAAPTPWVEKFVAANPVLALPEAVWTKLMPEKSYKFDDAAAGERPPRSWTTSFPHVYGSHSGGLGLWQSTAMPDEHIGNLAKAAITQAKLGQGKGTDYLGISFSMTDLVGHQFGPRSHEVQDVLARVDRILDDLLKMLDKKVGKNNYVLALSADHGVALVPEQLKAEGQDAGRFSISDMRAAVNKAIAAELGPGTYWVELQSNDIYLAPGIHDYLLGKPGAVGRVLAAIRGIPGIADAFDKDEISDAAKAADPVRKAAALSYYAGRSGDILILPKPNWIAMSGMATNHDSIYDYDQRVPLIFYGKGIKAAKYDRVISPADIAPTLGRLVGVTLPKAEGTAAPEVAP